MMLFGFTAGVCVRRAKGFVAACERQEGEMEEGQEGEGGSRGRPEKRVRNITWRDANRWNRQGMGGMKREKRHRGRRTHMHDSTARHVDNMVLLTADCCGVFVVVVFVVMVFVMVPFAVVVLGHWWHGWHWRHWKWAQI